MKRFIHKTLAAAALGSLLVGTAMAASTAVPLPSVQKSEAIEYMTGGIGKNEAKAIKHEGRNWPLTMEFTVKDKAPSEFAAHVDVKVHDAKGKLVMQAKSTGPFLLARLEPGHYTVDAQLDGATLHRTVEVTKDHHAKAVFVWPAGAHQPAS